MRGWGAAHLPNKYENLGSMPIIEKKSNIETDLLHIILLWISGWACWRQVSESSPEVTRFTQEFELVLPSSGKSNFGWLVFGTINTSLSLEQPHTTTPYHIICLCCCYFKKVALYMIQAGPIFLPPQFPEVLRFMSQVVLRF